MMSSRRSALLIARREAWRHKLHSLLVIAMVALPVIGLTVSDVVARSFQLSPIQKLDREIGRADAGLTLWRGQVTQAIDPISGEVETRYGGSQRSFESVPADLAQNLDPNLVARLDKALAKGQNTTPDGRQFITQLADARRVLPSRTTLTVTYSVSGAIAANGRAAGGGLEALDLSNPITAGFATITSGRAPTTDQPQAALTQPLANALHIDVGDSVTAQGKTFMVTGIAQVPSDLRAFRLFTSPRELATTANTQISLLADTQGRPVPWSSVQTLNQDGISVASRSVISAGGLPPGAINPNQFSSNLHAEEVGLATVAIGLAVLEAVLLAGAAFAVGARRQSRQLALVAAAGGSPGQIRDVVLSAGLVLGAMGTAAGLVIGIVAGDLVRPSVGSFAGHLSGPLDLRIAELIGIVLIGLITGVLAAVVPARQASQSDVVTVLNGRRPPLRVNRKMPSVGIVMIVVGAVIAAVAARPPAHFWGVLIGAVISELGFVLCAPAVVVLAGRTARWMPLPVRLALRDAERHRSRTGPAVAAILAAIAGITAASVAIASNAAFDRQSYVPLGRIGQTVLELSSNPHAAGIAEARAVVESQLKPTKLTPIYRIDKDLSLRGEFDGVSSEVQVAVGGASTLTAILGHPDAGAANALANGDAIGFEIGAASPGTTVGLQSRVPLYVVNVGHQGSVASFLISPATAKQFGQRVRLAAYLISTRTVPTASEVDALNYQLDTHAYLNVERGFQGHINNVSLLALALAALIVTIGATGIVTGLSAAESRPDLTTIGAVGGSPRTRRILVAAQAGTVALLGTLTGVVSGMVTIWAILGSSHYGEFPFTVPWLTLAEVVVGIPLLGALLMGGLTRSGLPVERRIA